MIDDLLLLDFDALDAGFEGFLVVGVVGEIVNILVLAFLGEVLFLDDADLLRFLLFLRVKVRLEKVQEKLALSKCTVSTFAFCCIERFRLR